MLPIPGRLHKLTDSTGATTFGYDLHGRVKSKVHTVGTVGLNVGYGFTTQGQAKSVTYPSGMLVEYVYTNAQVSGMKVNGQNLTSGMTYDPFGPLKGWTWANGKAVSRNYDLDGRLDTYTYGNTVLDTNYYPSGNVKEILDTTNSANNQTFGYDALYRLNSHTGYGRTYGYGYDGNGNRSTTTVDGTSYTNVVDTASNRLYEYGRTGGEDLCIRRYR